MGLYIGPEKYNLKKTTFKFKVKEVLFKPVDVVFDKKEIDDMKEITNK